ncbi:MAG: hypothetical protein ACI4S4_00660 [Candidatus Ornithospirochaeta sp.]
MKDPLLFVLLAIVGVFLYFVVFKGVIYPILILLIVVVSALWYVANNYISRKMVAAARGEDSFFFQKAQMVDESGTELVSGVILATKNEIVFARRKNYWGGVAVVWSTFTSALSSYRIDYIDEKRKGIIFTVKGDKKEKKFICPKIAEREDDFRSNIGW